jgi:D-glycero-D-manno-heptose 1,7-bisphosphate phosphatase
MVLLPGVLDAARELRNVDYLIVIATNQRGVARTKVKTEELESIHQHLLELFSAAGAPITKIYVCPHEEGCGCRKPAPGMLMRAAEENSIDLKASWMVGESPSDVEADKRAGCRTIRIGEDCRPDRRQPSRSSGEQPALSRGINSWSGQSIASEEFARERHVVS